MGVRGNSFRLSGEPDLSRGLNSERMARMPAGPLQGRGGMGAGGRSQVWEVTQVCVVVKEWVGDGAEGRVASDDGGEQGTVGTSS